MKNKRIVASLSRIRVPDDRREAMLNNILAQAGVDSARCEPKGARLLFRSGEKHC